MTTNRPTPPNSPQPRGNARTGKIDEELLLAYIEGELGGDEAAAVERDLASDVQLARCVMSMRVDLAAARTLPEPKVPAGLLSRVEAVLEREALVGLSVQSAGVRQIRPSAIEPERDGVLSVLVRRVGGFRLAAAAALLLTAGAGYWLVGTVLRQIPEVNHNLAATNNHERAALPGGNGDGPVTNETALADAGTPGVGATNAGATDVAAATSAVAAADGSATPIPTATGSEMSLARALELAGQGRLMIVVETRSAETTLARVENLAARTGGDLRWKHLASSDGSVPAEYASLVESRPIAEMRQRPVLLADDAPAAPVEVGAAPKLEPVLKGLYLVRLSERERELRSLLSALTSGPDQVASLVELDGPVEATGALDADSVLWWSGSPSKWVRKVRVPVVVQSERVGE